MQIENDTCYIKHYLIHDEVFVSLTHYLEIWENGYSEDGYTIDYENIYYEGADHHGYDTDRENAGTCISKNQYLEWTKQIQQAKETAISMMRQAATPINRKLKVGDFLLYYEKGYIEESYQGDGAFWGMRIVDVDGDSLSAQYIFIGKHSFDSSDELDYHESSLKDIQANSSFITEEAFMATHDYMRNFCRHLLEEIKSLIIALNEQNRAKKKKPKIIIDSAEIRREIMKAMEEDDLEEDDND